MVNGMEALILENEPIIRLGAFVAVFATMALWEVAAPRREATFSRWKRWPNNLGIVVLNTLVLRLLFPVAAVATARIVDRSRPADDPGIEESRYV